MNHILYNIAIIMLLAGIIIITSYITKAYNKPVITTPTCNNINNQDENITIEQVYKLRPSTIYKTMFNEPSIWQGYESLST